MYVQVIYENGITVETKLLPDDEAIKQAKTLLSDSKAEYCKVRVIKDNGELLFEEVVSRT